MTLVPFHDCSVPRIVFTPCELERIDAIAAELEYTAKDFFADARPALSEEQWLLLNDYTRACVRRALEIGSMLHAIVDASPCAISYQGRGRAAFVKAGLETWRDCFAPVPEIWKLAALCDKIPGGEQRVMGDVAVLEVMAANRMFSTFEDEFATFFRAGR